MTGCVPFSETPTGETVHRITLCGGGLTAHLLSYGATVQDLRLEGHSSPLVLGSDHLTAYLGPLHYVGALVGRFSNRISGGCIQIDGQIYQVDRNDGDKHCLHGGRDGVSNQVWSIGEVGPSHAVFHLTLDDGHMGFPGRLEIEASFSLSNRQSLDIEIVVRTDAPTPVSFAHHGYFNLDGTPDITGHFLQIDAPEYLPVDEEGIPSGETRKIDGTEYDFRAPRDIGQMRLDHNFCLSRQRQPGRRAATIYAPRSGLAMRVTTTEPGLQVYDGAHFPQVGLGGLDNSRISPRAGIALEAQAWPDAPNQPGFPNATLKPGQTYHQKTSYGFFTFDPGDL